MKFYCMKLWSVSLAKIEHNFRVFEPWLKVMFMSTWGATRTGHTLPAVAHSGKYLASLVSLPEDEEASKIFQNILTEPQHA